MSSVRVISKQEKSRAGYTPIAGFLDDRQVLIPFRFPRGTLQRVARAKERLEVSRRIEGVRSLLFLEPLVGCGSQPPAQGLTLFFAPGERSGRGLRRISPVELWPLGRLLVHGKTCITNTHRHPRCQPFIPAPSTPPESRECNVWRVGQCLKPALTCGAQTDAGAWTAMPCRCLPADRRVGFSHRYLTSRPRVICNCENKESPLLAFFT